MRISHNNPSPVHYKNTYQPVESQPPKDLHADTRPEDYDFYFNSKVECLLSDRVELRPFVPSLHGQLVWKEIQRDRDLITYIPFLWPNYESFLTSLEQSRSNPEWLFYAIYTSPPDAPGAIAEEDYLFAGMVGTGNVSFENRSAELNGFIVIPEFQHTHVATHAAGILLHKILDDTTAGGYGFRRCFWKAQSANVKSVGFALKMGFSRHGINRAAEILPPGKESTRPGRPGEAKADYGSRDSWEGSIIWEEWKTGASDWVDQLMHRK